VSAEVLRQAAALMRERATGLPDAPWSVAPGPAVKDAAGVKVASAALDTVPRDRTPIVQHIASWHPAVALAVADWLEEVAAWMDEGVGLLPATNIGDVWIGMRQHALAVARTYLGSDA
jgi:hypothetical protein